MSTSISLLNNNNLFTTLDNGSSGKVAVYWNGKSVTDESAPGSQQPSPADTPYGPVPLVDISRTYNNDNGNISHITTNITLTGKVVSFKPGIVFNDVIKKSKKLEDLFKACLFGSFAIMCGPSVAYSGDDFYLKQIDFKQTNNNWTRFLDYTIAIESKTPISGNIYGNTQTITNDLYSRYVESRSDVWTIEPLQDYTFSRFDGTINPVLLSPENDGPGGKNNKVLPAPPAGAVGGGAVGPSIAINFLSVPQFKISRKLSAKGLPVSGQLPVSCSSSSGLDQINRIRFLNAKAWVNKESDKVIGDTGHTTHSGSIRIGEVYPFSLTGTWFYNHIRTINADIYNGTYEVNDSWLAMPTGIGYTETFTLDSSTSANGIRTVRVAGSVQGLHIHNIQQTDDTQAFITGTPDPHVSIVPALTVNLSGAINDTFQMPRPGSKMPSALSQTSTVTNIEKNKYANAASGWVNEVKPYLYRRACLGNEYSVTPQFQVNRFKPLAVIPVSMSEGHDPHKGIITYNYEYNNKYRAISGVLSENINIVDDAPVNNIVETSVMGRELGPIIQSLGTTNPRRTITIDLVVQTPTGINSALRTSVFCPLYISGTIYGAVQSVINGNKPFDMRTGPIWTNFSRTTPTSGNVFTQSDSESWEPTQGRYSRTVSWIYKQCNPLTNFMET